MIVNATITTTGHEDILFSGHSSSRFDASFKKNVLNSDNHEYDNCHIIIMRIKKD